MDILKIALQVSEKTELDIEGAPQATNQEIVDLLKKILSAKYSIEASYRSFADRVKGPWRDSLVEHWTEHAKEERDSAYQIAMKVVGLGGDPEVLSIVVPPCPSDLASFFNSLAIQELQAIEACRQLIVLAGDMTSLKVLAENTILVDTQHLDDLTRMGDTLLGSPLLFRWSRVNTMGRTKPTVVKLEPEVKYELLKFEVGAEFHDFEIRKKADSKLMKTINVLLLIISFGQAKDFMTKFSTTLGNKIYVNDSWDQMSAESRMILLRHERVHMRQAKKYGRFLFSFLYLFVFLPVGLAYFRAKFEKEAYEESIKAEIELRGTDRVKTPEYQNWLASQFLGAGYLYSWPFKNHIHGWVRKTIDKAVSESSGQDD